MNRHILFRHYWWLGFLLGGIAAASAFAFGGENRAALVGAVVAGTLGFYYFIQQQKLAETHLFYSLFTAFNARYDNMNDRLSDLSDRARADFSDSDCNLIVDYFNLCAEEYLFYKEGYIHRDVWRSWCRGMREYLRRDSFRCIWNQEVKTGSYYGLSLAVIEHGAS